MIIVLGGGESGVGAAILAKTKGLEVFLSDKNAITEPYKQLLQQYDIPFEENQHTELRILQAAEVVKSPGIPEKAPIIQAIRKANIQICSEIEFASRYTDAKIIAITGSNGKTTTTSLIYHLLKTANFNVALAGNIGDSFALHVATQPPPDWYVLEVSSFQLDDVQSFRPHIALLTNLTPDHLDRYNYNFDEYAAAKLNIVKFQTYDDYFIYNEDDEATNLQLSKLAFQTEQHGFTLETFPNVSIDVCTAYTTADELVFADIIYIYTVPISALTLKGKHNLANALAAGMAAVLAGLTDEKLLAEGFRTFTPLEHRLEPVATIDGVTYINNSKATNVDSAWYALDAMT